MLETDFFNAERELLTIFVNANDKIKIEIIQKIKPEFFMNDDYREVFRYCKAEILNESQESLKEYPFLKQAKKYYGLFLDIASEYKINQALYQFYCNRLIENFKEAKELDIKDKIASGTLSIEQGNKELQEAKKLVEHQADDPDILTSVFSDYYKGYECVKSNYSYLDNLTGGFHKSELIILAGAASMGKTAAGLNITMNATKAGCKTLFVSLEMNKKALLNRLTCAESGLEASKFRNRTFTSDELAIYEDVLKNKILKLPLNIIDTPNMTVQDIKAEALHLQKTTGLNFLVIDYLGLIKPQKPHQNKYLEVTELTRELKILAGELDIPVMVLCQLSRANAERKDKRPQLSDLRDSGSIEQDADIVMFVYRDEYYNLQSEDTGKIEILIKKHRDGSLGFARLNFDKNTQKISDPLRAVC